MSQKAIRHFFLIKSIGNPNISIEEIEEDEVDFIELDGLNLKKLQIKLAEVFNNNRKVGYESIGIIIDQDNKENDRYELISTALNKALSG